MRVFACDPLKRRGAFHDEFAGDAFSIEEAQVLRQLDTADNWPVLTALESIILAAGTDDPLAHIATRPRTITFADAGGVLASASRTRTTPMRARSPRSIQA